MATLVLTTVGRVIGGPIGGALGALAGQAIDARLFRGAAREGPRLSDLAVQTSSYGTPIPQLFGTIRVAGTVIWSTDLIETRSSSRAGKGQPGTNTYSYSASFAVALSARPIRGVRRIWAEGKLLRGAAGDWKSRTGFRLHLGGEDQPVDPLIASAMGVTPAYRGIAYAVFEGMQLADYGNRIPSLTFEVEADAAAVSSGVIAAALGDDVRAAGGVPVDGFAASGASVRAVLETLATIDGGWWRPVGAGVERREDGGAAVTLVDRGVGTHGDGERRHRSVSGLAGVPREVAVAHHDPARDYQIGVQRVRRPGPGERIDRVELPAALSGTAAKGVAAALIARGERERMRRRVALDIDALAVRPGDIVALDGEAGRWRVAAMRVEALVTTLDLVPLGPIPVVGPASSGRVAGATDLTAGRTLLVAAEWPCLDDQPLSAPRISVIATGEGAGWRQAALLYSLDDGASWTSAGGTAAPGIMGRVDGGLIAASERLVDRRSRLVVTLARADMMLGDADAPMRGGGANLALVGDELLQFERAEPLGAGRWVLTGLRRGLRGTEAAIGAQGEGTRFALIERDGVVAIDLPPTAIGGTVRLLVTGVGDVAAPAIAEVRVTGVSVAPPAPVHVVLEDAADGTRMLRWTRRSRAGWAWRDGVDVPLAEEREAYRVVFVDRDGAERVVEVGEPRCVVPDDGASIASVRIAQRGTLAMSADRIVPWEENR